MEQFIDCAPINGYEYKCFKRGYHHFIKLDENNAELEIKLSDSDFLDDEIIDFMTKNNITK